MHKTNASRAKGQRATAFLDDLQRYLQQGKIESHRQAATSVAETWETVNAGVLTIAKRHVSLEATRDAQRVELTRQMKRASRRGARISRTKPATSVSQTWALLSRARAISKNGKTQEAAKG